jgi:hypothetical protein
MLHTITAPGDRQGTEEEETNKQGTENKATDETNQKGTKEKMSGCLDTSDGASEAASDAASSNVASLYDKFASTSLTPVRAHDFTPPFRGLVVWWGARVGCLNTHSLQQSPHTGSEDKQPVPFASYINEPPVREIPGARSTKQELLVIIPAQI